jgi:uncharacterized protein
LSSDRTAAEERFIVDAMLGRLARWLRTLGYDSIFDPELHDPELVTLAAAENRILLTRDRHLVSHLRPARALLIASDSPMDQLRQVVEECRLRLPRVLFTRCLVCNGILREATASEVEEMVPERSRELGHPVMFCAACGRIYWRGSHSRRMRAALAAAFPGLDW